MSEKTKTNKTPKEESVMIVPMSQPPQRGALYINVARHMSIRVIELAGYATKNHNAPGTTFPRFIYEGTIDQILAKAARLVKAHRKEGGIYTDLAVLADDPDWPGHQMLVFSDSARSRPKPYSMVDRAFADAAVPAEEAE